METTKPSGGGPAIAAGVVAMQEPGLNSEQAGDRQNNTLRAYREIRRRILDNEMPPGSQYLEQELAEMLGMSRTPVREALIRLADERLVEVRPRHGARVLPVSPEDMREIYDILTELEAMAARKVAERGLTDVQRAGLEAALTQMDTALARGDVKAWLVGDHDFHDRLVAASGNTRLCDMVRVFVDQSHRARMQTLSQRPLPRQSNVDHMAVFNAIQRRDGEAAYQLHHKHREAAGRLLAELLEQLQPRH